MAGPRLVVSLKMEMNPHPYRDVRQGRGPSVGLAG
jgi:hypothetical protein